MSIFKILFFNVQVNRQRRGQVDDVMWLNPFTSKKIEDIRATVKFNFISREREREKGNLENSSLQGMREIAWEMSRLSAIAHPISSNGYIEGLRYWQTVKMKFQFCRTNSPRRPVICSSWSSCPASDMAASCMMSSITRTSLAMWAFFVY